MGKGAPGGGDCVNRLSSEKRLVPGRELANSILEKMLFYTRALNKYHVPSPLLSAGAQVA